MCVALDFEEARRSEVVLEVGSTLMRAMVLITCCNAGQCNALQAGWLARLARRGLTWQEACLLGAGVECMHLYA